MSSIQYSKVATERIPIFCPRKKEKPKLLGRIDAESLAQLEQVPGGQWLWCRDCHMEHYKLWKDIGKDANGSD